MGTPLPKVKLIEGRIYQLEFMNNAGRRVEQIVAEYQGDVLWLTKYGSRRYIKLSEIIKAIEVEELR